MVTASRRSQSSSSGGEPIASSGAKWSEAPAASVGQSSPTATSKPGAATCDSRSSGPMPVVAA